MASSVSTFAPKLSLATCRSIFSGPQFAQKGSTKVPDQAFTSNLTPQAFVLLRRSGLEGTGPYFRLSLRTFLSPQRYPNGGAENPKRRAHQSNPGVGYRSGRDDDPACRRRATLSEVRA